MTGQFTEVSQAEFARRCGVSRAAVSQWKSNDILKTDAFSKEGKKGKLFLEIAMQQVRDNRDIGQSLGNGLTTETELPADSVPVKPAGPEVIEPFHDTHAVPHKPLFGVPPSSTPEEDQPSVDQQIRLERLERERRRNRKEAEEEALRRGTLMPATEARAEMARVAGMMLRVFEGALPDMAAAVAARFEVPQRDVLHLLKDEYRKMRQTASNKERGVANEQEPVVRCEVQDGN